MIFNLPHYLKISLFFPNRPHATHSSSVADERHGHNEQLPADADQPSAVDAAAGHVGRRNAAHHRVPAAERHRVPHFAAAAASDAADATDDAACVGAARAAQAAEEGRDGGGQTRAHRPHQVDARRPERGADCPVPHVFHVPRSNGRPAAADAAARHPGAILLRADHWHHSADLAPAADPGCSLLIGCDHLPRCADRGPRTKVTGKNNSSLFFSINFVGFYLH